MPDNLAKLRSGDSPMRLCPGRSFGGMIKFYLEKRYPLLDLTVSRHGTKSKPALCWILEYDCIDFIFWTLKGSFVCTDSDVEDMVHNLILQALSMANYDAALIIYEAGCLLDWKARRICVWHT